jgi:hypothetical protein
VARRMVKADENAGESGTRSGEGDDGGGVVMREGGMCRGRLVQSLYISSEPAISFQSALSKFQQLAASPDRDTKSADQNSCLAAGPSEPTIRGCWSANPGDVSTSHTSVSDQLSDRSMDVKQQTISPSTDCKTIQTDESFLQLYRRRRKTAAKRTEPAVENTHAQRNPQKSFLLFAGDSIVTEDNRMVNLLKEASAQPLEARLDLPKSPEATQRLKVPYISRSEGLPSDICITSPRFTKPVRGQCAAMSSSPRPPLSASAAEKVPSVRSPVISVQPACPYRRSLSHSSHCLLSSGQQSASSPMVTWQGRQSRGWDAILFSDHVYEGQSTLV